jgi:predicted nucleic acid-binding protein
MPDPKDDHLLELAAASGTRFIVSHNKKDFKGAETFGIKPITPKELLEEIS